MTNAKEKMKKIQKRRRDALREKERSRIWVINHVKYFGVTLFAIAAFGLFLQLIGIFVEP